MAALQPAGPAWLRNLARAWRGLLFPPACLGCGGVVGEGELLCPACARQVLPPPAPLCRQCGAPQAQAHGLCPGCRLAPPAISRARAVALHHGPLAEAVRRFKYDGRYSLGPGLAALLARDAPPELLGWAELAAPVPLHPWRLLRRGFNQAQELARGLEKHHGLTVTPGLLRRLRHTRPQVGLPSRARAANVAGAFGVNPRLAHLAQGRRVLLLDDVLTTGATVAECARVLIAAGAAEVSVLTLTRAPVPGGGVPGAGRASRGGSGDAPANSELARSN